MQRVPKRRWRPRVASVKGNNYAYCQDTYEDEQEVETGRPVFDQLIIDYYGFIDVYLP
jgi:hypothetical protein